MCHNVAGHRSRLDKYVCEIPASPLFCYGLAMLDVDKTLPKDPDKLRQFTALLLTEVKS
ncbi:hypothetical protein MACH17_28490 [Phaeobacter inhibens]|nr:hypothetical protein MACH17_01670 [Phaeobacter inhibens]GLO70406.1 hypothetical protein MACH17_19230 [Phaeobacter inhibens]GLO71332.1 hypothetical protein MACH17_28490 [Phaeobacter inhibens]